MKRIEDVTACVVDHGLYLPLARKLAESYKRVLYYTPWEKAFPTVADTCLGDGFGDIERCQDFWEERGDIDLFVFPDVLHSGLQLELSSMGYPVWGSGTGDSLELQRGKFLEELKRTGLPMPSVKVVTGISGLRAELHGQTDKYLKISTHRGTMETWHWRDWQQDSGQLDILAVKLGPLADLKKFYVCDPIETDLETGGDTYCIDGQFPAHMLEAYEWKDKSSFGAFKPRTRISEPIQAVLEAFGPILASHSYRNYFSVEVRVRDGQGYFIDPCCRGPMPMTCSQLELYGNLAEIIYAGANGDLVEPEPTAKFCCEVALTTKVQPSAWARIEVPKELANSMKVIRCCQVGKTLCLPPDESESQEMMVGWLVATGSTPRETLEKQLAQAEQLPDGVCAATGSLVDLLKEIQSADEQGLPLTRQAMPEPEEAIADG